MIGEGNQQRVQSYAVLQKLETRRAQLQLSLVTEAHVHQEVRWPASLDRANLDGEKIVTWTAEQLAAKAIYIEQDFLADRLAEKIQVRQLRFQDVSRSVVAVKSALPTIIQIKLSDLSEAAADPPGDVDTHEGRQERSAAQAATRAVGDAAAASKKPRTDAGAADKYDASKFRDQLMAEMLAALDLPDHVGASREAHEFEGLISPANMQALVQLEDYCKTSDSGETSQEHQSSPSDTW